MKLSRLNLIKIYNVLEALAGRQDLIKPFLFKYVSKKIRELIKPEIDALKEVEPKKLYEYNEKVKQLHMEFAEKDEEGQFKFVAGASAEKATIADLVVKDSKGLGEAIAKLNAETNMQELMDDDKRYADFLKEEIEVELPKIKVEKDGLKFFDELGDDVVDLLFPLIEEGV